MKTPTNISRMTSALVLAAFALTTGIASPAYCQDRSLSGPGTRALPSNSSWVPTGNLNAAHTSHTATLLSNGKVLVVGGRGSDSSITADPELYDPGTGQWSVAGRLNKPRGGGHTATLLPDGRVLVVAGDTSNAPPDFGRGGTAELYDPSSGTWTLTGSVNIARSGHSATLLQSGKILVAGGYFSDTLAGAELYDPASGTWSATGSLNVARYWHSATLLQDGRVLVAGEMSERRRSRFAIRRGVVRPGHRHMEPPATSTHPLSVTRRRCFQAARSWSPGDTCLTSRKGLRSLVR
jgi:N-acetylneuraminic acid mutarotase